MHICVALKDKLVLVFVLNDRVGGKREMGAPGSGVQQRLLRRKQKLGVVVESDLESEIA